MVDVHDRVREAATILPKAPGVYLFKNSRGRVIYVGKAKNLRARVRQYMTGQDERPMVPHLLGAATALDVTEVRTEKEAFILEDTLIKKHRPRYNVQLRDDTGFLHLRIDPSSTWPRYTLTREMETRARHFGPYASAHRARLTLEFLSRRFPLRTCSDEELKRRRRPCLLHQMHRCMAPCVELCSDSDYADVVIESMLFLEGKNKELLGRLHSRMLAHAETEQFEEAARVRDLIQAVEASLESQITVDRRGGDRDCWAMARDGNRAMVALIPYRQGRMQEARTYPADNVIGDDAEVINTLLLAWYGNPTRIPDSVLVSSPLSDMSVIESILRERRGRKVELSCPRRGDKLKAIDLALKNAQSALRRAMLRDARTDQALERLKEIARLSRLPRHIECFDNSNIQGTDPVASQVVFIDGVPDRQRYRRYKVRSVQGPDDYATMREILGRRIKRSRKQDAKPTDALPDLIVVDGGKGQVSVVRAVLADLGCHDLAVVGLAKPRVEHARGERHALDKLVIPGLKDPLRLRSGDPVLMLLQALRDESHRTAVQFHRKTRRKRRLVSQLDGIDGVGPSRRKALLTRFGSVTGVRGATVDELSTVPGIGAALAVTIRDMLKKAD